MKAVVVSPHLDDAVLGCGVFLARAPGATVVTVCAGVPRPDSQLTEWDAACGFGSAREAIEARRDEDRQALATLGALPRCLDYLDDQYGQEDSEGSKDSEDRQWISSVARDVRRVIREIDPDVVLCPLGLFHHDHDRVHAAARLVLQQEQDRTWYAYEDALYRRIPGLVQQRLAELAANHVVATPADLAPGAFSRRGSEPTSRACRQTPPGPLSGPCPPSSSLTSFAAASRAKRRAILCYASQLRGLGTPGRPGHRDALAPESYWKLSPGDGKERAP